MDIVSRIPAPITTRPASPGAASYANSGVVYDYAIGGQPFLSGASDDRPLRIGMAPIKKDQFDDQREPGEQSLAGWWLRSQSTFIGGEGLLYQDPDLVQVANIQNRHAIQYGHGLGVDPWTNGQLTLLRDTVKRVSDTGSDQHFVLGYHDTADRYWSAVGSVLKSDDGTTATSVTWGGTGTIVSLTSDGTNYFAADATGVYSGAGAETGSLVWDTGSADTVVRWVKGRLMAGIGASVYELADDTGAPTLPTAKMTHLNSSFVWTDFAEGTDGIFACGYAGAQGAVYKFVLDSTGAVPTLASGGVLTAQLPRGEVVYCMASYLGTYVGLGTSRGFRLAQIDSSGDLVYGPLLIENPEGVRGIAAYDRFLFVAGTDNLDDKSGLWRVDLGQPIQSGSDGAVRFAYATDLQAGVTGAVSSVTNFGTSDRMAFAVVGSGSYLESADTLVETGYLQTGRVRYSTLEPKIFKSLSVRTPSALDGSVAASIGDPSGSVTSVFTAGESGGARIDDVLLPAPSTAVEWAQLRLDLDRSSTDDTAGPVVTGWQFKALPGSVRQRIFQVPLALFDREKTASGQSVGREGRAAERLEAFAALARRGDAVSFQNLGTGMSHLVVIDDYQFEQKASPGLGKNVYGGYLTVQLRTIAEVVSS